MKKLLIILFVILAQCTLMFCQANPNNFPVLKGPYLGQKPPGNKPEIFAPGIISHPDYFEHSAAVFSPDGNEVYWSATLIGERYFKIFFMKLINGQWTERQTAGFCTENKNFDSPSFSKDGKKLFFAADGDIWYVELQGNKWTSAKKLPSTINSPASERMGAITGNESIYFTRYPGFEIWVTKKVNGYYTEPAKLEKTINFDNANKTSVFVAPDESYLILEASKDNATSELFVSFKQKNSSWSECKKLPINWGRFPSVSPDGKYLFFMTRDGIYWVSTKIVQELRPKE